MDSLISLNLYKIYRKCQHKFLKIYIKQPLTPDPQYLYENLTSFFVVDFCNIINKKSFNK